MGAKHENIFVLGPTGVGKSFVASALAQKACRDGILGVLCAGAGAVPRSGAGARGRQSAASAGSDWATIDVMVIDDWAMAPLTETERRDFWEICEERYQARSTILTSQLPITRWHEQIGDPTLADGILDRLVHNAHRIEMRGDSMRKTRGKPWRQQALRVAAALSGAKDGVPFPAPLSPLGILRLRSGTQNLDEAEHLVHNRKPASLRSDTCPDSSRNPGRLPSVIGVRLHRNHHYTATCGQYLS